MGRNKKDAALHKRAAAPKMVPPPAPIAVAPLPEEPKPKKDPAPKKKPSKSPSPTPAPAAPKSTGRRRSLHLLLLFIVLASGGFSYWLWTTVDLARVFTAEAHAAASISGGRVAQSLGFVTRTTAELAVSAALTPPAGALLPTPYRIVHGPRGSGKTTLVLRALAARVDSARALYVANATEDAFVAAAAPLLPGAGPDAKGGSRLEEALRAIAAAAHAFRRVRFAPAVLVVGAADGSADRAVVDRLREFAADRSARQDLMTVFVIDDALLPWFAPVRAEAMTLVGDLPPDTASALLRGLAPGGAAELADLVRGRLSLLAEYAAFRRAAKGNGGSPADFALVLRERARKAFEMVRPDCASWEAVVALVDADGAEAVPLSRLDAPKVAELVAAGVATYAERLSSSDLAVRFAWPYVMQHAIEAVGRAGTARRTKFLEEVSCAQLRGPTVAGHTE